MSDDLECPNQYEPIDEGLARWRREFEAARTFEDDEIYFPLRPPERPNPRNAASDVSKNLCPRPSALQNGDLHGRGPQPPRKPKQSLPQHYDPDKHGSWRPSARSSNLDTSIKQPAAPDVDVEEARTGFQQFVRDAEEQALQAGAGNYDMFGGVVWDQFHERKAWECMPAWQRRHIAQQRAQSMASVPRGPALAATLEQHESALGHGRDGSESLGSSENAGGGQSLQQQLGGQYSRNGLVWKATYGGNF